LAHLPQRSVLVLDDLPEADVTDGFDEGLVLLGHVCAELKIILLTTAARPLSRYVMDRAPSFSEINAPPFSDEDVISLLKVFKASDEHLKPWFVGYIKLVTHNNPLLLRAAAQHCEAKGWPPLETFSDLLGNRFADDVNADTMRLLESTIVDETTRELLYRLQVIGPRFTINDVRIAAAITPSIAHPLERLRVMNGIWIEKDSQSEYIISPRVARLPSGNLSPATERDLHIAVASSVLRKRVLNQLDVLKAFTHYITAGDPQSALSVLLLALRAFAVATESNLDDWMITSIWYDVPLPAEFSVVDRIELRTAQILARKKVGKEARGAALGLFSLLQGGGSIPAKALVPAAFATTLELMAEKPVETARFLRDAIRAIAEDGTLPPAVARRMRLTCAQMFWGPGSYCRANDQVFQWFSVIFELAPEELGAMCRSEIAYQAARHICDGIWRRNDDLPIEDRRWPGVLDELTDLTNRAVRAEARPLIAGLVRARIIIMMDYLRDADHANGLAREIGPLLQAEAAGEFLVASTLGQQYYFLNLHAAAGPWLDRAVELERAGEIVDRIYAFLYAGIVKASSSLSESVALTGRAAEIALSGDHVPLTLRVRALGERAIALWRASGLASAYEPLRDAAEMLLESDLSGDKERSLFLLFGNSLSYFIQTRLWSVAL
jgi:hypothetical protein